MSVPPGSVGLHRVPRGLGRHSTVPPNRGPSADDALPDRVVRCCSACGGELSVAERMFYFLEAVDAPTHCRACLGQVVRAAALPGEAPVSTALAVVPPPLAEGVTEEGLFEGLFLDSIRDLLSEELRRSGVALEGFRPQDPRIRAARDLHNEARWLLEVDRLREAVQSVRELRSLLTALGEHGAAVAPDPTAAVDPTVDELYERVLHRASVLSARLHSDLGSGETSFEAAEDPSGALVDAWAAPQAPSAVTETTLGDPPETALAVPVEPPRRPVESRARTP